MIPWKNRIQRRLTHHLKLVGILLDLRTTRNEGGFMATQDASNQGVENATKKQIRTAETTAMQEEHNRL